MESVDSPSTSLVKCCDCGCDCSTLNWSMRSVNCRHEELKGEGQFTIPAQNARVEMENECTALRETVRSQQEKIQDLICELDEERNASSSSANEAMSMILRLQSEKAEVDMVARQFKRFSEERMAHDQEEMLALEELLYEKDNIIELLTSKVQAYKNRMMSYGLTEANVDELSVDVEKREMSQSSSVSENLEGQSELPGFDIYPRLKCKTKVSDTERYASGETPRTIQPDNVFEKAIVGQSPRRSGHRRQFSTSSSNSPLAKEMVPNYTSASPNFSRRIKKTDYSHLGKAENASEFGDDMSDRVYTIDSIHQRASVTGVTHHGDSLKNSSVGDLEIQKLYARLQALEADRETMRQSINSVGTDKAQVALLKEIAQNLCKVMNQSGAMPLQKSARSSPPMSLAKSVASLFTWRRRAQRCKYTVDRTTENPGLVALLERSPRMGQQRYISCTNLRK